MKKFNKGMVITSTVAAALAALTFAGCGSTEIAPKAAPTNSASAVQAVKNEEAEMPAAAVSAEAAGEKTAETTTAKKSSKKKSKKKKAKTAEKTAEPAQQTVQPVVIVPTVQVQPAVQSVQTQPAAQPAAQPAVQPQKADEAPANTQAPAAVVPADVYPVWVEGDVYAGSYYEETAGRGMMDITRNSDGTYSVEVNWASSASEKNIWNFTGEFNGRGLMNYTNCRKTNAAYDANGNGTFCTIYTMGSGYIEFKDEGVLEWHDDMGDILPGTRFVSKTAYNKANVTNTKANETATAGSNYVDETPAAELPTGWFKDGNGSGTIMNITKNGDSYKFVVSYPDEKGTCYHTYSFSGKLENGKVSYSGGQQDDLVYNADNSVKSAKFVSNDHKGQIEQTNTGIVWHDSYGPHFVFVKS